MHPAPSVILFTVLSGAGFGYLALLGLGAASTGWPAFWQFALAFAMAVGGLVSSVFHLGNPQRGLLAFTQWRTSWLSREGWASVATLLVMGLFAIAAIFFAAILPILGVIGAALSVATVFVTSMIYAQMKTVPRWNSPLTPTYFIACALTAGAILSAIWSLALILLVALGLLQVSCWMSGDGRFAQRGHDMNSATGLHGQIRMFESPHSGTNYLLQEFGFQVARRHAAKLRVICICLISVLPAIMLLFGAHPIAFGLAFALHLLGVFVSRWLFFAEARHVVQLYYGREAVAA
ncbi:dimethyl sulfoxide reductase anchor subunit [Paracoccus sp. R12_1]|uniref:dimethyl sulfoxide reductase anchor subunit family protein n=1 Tax=unclassified Paracoccus (in: a-proteobacteria) TaxID=2688777 RepID=UPI000C0A7718|nr:MULTISPECIES: DmsC/YnfH family molybdoenzyme membrane anchor subunit [unclassified Paracoccus (in: a-proteobacteria)]MBO9457177.1 dimethyl sulfoxide reductase anchor subunit [Paracoccus sp. R12_2]MBO9488394.1 dimethyl sulfoxide reductase anchor subunit [Paracoccus sp. R12_1]PHQ71581.1 MAG: dibenzothiophene desulfurase [Paracoccus sp. (in: a-proteobacteria)]